MLVSIKYTPNPNSVQFFVDKNWIDIFWECKDEFTAQKSPLTKKLWLIKGITYILVGKNFLIINKSSLFHWNDLIPLITNEIKLFIEKENHIFSLSKEKIDEIINSQKIKDTNKVLNEIEKKICNLLEEKVQPALELHGGGVQFVYLKKDILGLKLIGACVGCPSSVDTVKFGITQLIQFYFPEIKKIKLIE